MPENSLTSKAFEVLQASGGGSTITRSEEATGAGWIRTNGSGVPAKVARSSDYKSPAINRSATAPKTQITANAPELGVGRPVPLDRSLAVYQVGSGTLGGVTASYNAHSKQGILTDASDI